ncbi:SLC13 family permease [Halobacillus sp. KGW1]|uniref:SLC13 family permease n=1 Tax=Halobacillus sp. KGW1 TaxID=1793726 RepID=UPI00078044E6|nr:SLC13 family permease [Halobacillus sp. KGW1]
MTWEMGFVLLVVLVMMICLFKEVARPDIIVFVALIAFLAVGIITPEEAISGFSNEGMLTVAMLFVIAGVIQKSGLVERSVAALLGKGKSERRSLFRFLVPISGASAFLNNTPIVVTLTPIVREWCADHNISPSKFLIPLSYASILGGILTLMGTSTNLVVHGLLLERGMEGYSLFTLAQVSLPASLIGLIYLVTVGYRILPDYKPLNKRSGDERKQYLMEVVVENHFPAVNRTVEEAGLRNLEGVYLLAIARSKDKVCPVKNSTTIKAGDRLIFTGIISKIAELQDKKGLTIKTGTDVSLEQLENGHGRLVEVVVSHQSSLLHRKIKETQFRATFDAGVVAVHRNNERIESKIGDIELRAGDTLLLLTGADFQERAAQSKDFYVVTPLKKHPLLNKMSSWKAWTALLSLVGMIGLVTMNALSMFTAMSILVVFYLLCKIVTPDEAKQNVQFHVLLLIASAFGIGQALFKTGAAEWVAGGLIRLSDPFGIFGALVLLYVLTALFTEMITNNAAAVLMFPIAVEAANRLGVEPMAFVILVTIGASASFLSPIGYQTNLIVYGPGGYRFKDYLKVGLPLSFLVMASTIWMVDWIWI